MEFVEAWSYLTLVVTLGMFLSGLFPCLDMYRSKSTQNVPYNIFLLSAISCLGMCHYGLMIDNGILVFLNGVGAFLQTLYVVLYLLVARPKAKPLFYLFLAIVYDFMLYMYIYTRLHDSDERAGMLGSCSSTLTSIIMTLPAIEISPNIPGIGIATVKLFIIYLYADNKPKTE